MTRDPHADGSWMSLADQQELAELRGHLTWALSRLSALEYTREYQAARAALLSGGEGAR